MYGVPGGAAVLDRGTKLTETCLALLRHGHTAWNRAGRLQGRIDEPLDGEARAHLGRLCLPEEFELATLVSSPLARATETASIVGRRVPLAWAALLLFPGIYCYDSGLVLGADVDTAVSLLGLIPADTVYLICTPALAELYDKALAQYGLKTETLDGDACALAGLVRIHTEVFS